MGILPVRMTHGVEGRAAYVGKLVAPWKWHGLPAREARPGHGREAFHYPRRSWLRSGPWWRLSGAGLLTPPPSRTDGLPAPRPVHQVPRAEPMRASGRGPGGPNVEAEAPRPVRPRPRIGASRRLTASFRGPPHPVAPVLPMSPWTVRPGPAAREWAKGRPRPARPRGDVRRGRRSGSPRSAYTVPHIPETNPVAPVMSGSASLKTRCGGVPSSTAWG
jgi:hypothetical protein